VGAASFEFEIVGGIDAVAGFDEPQGDAVEQRISMRKRSSRIRLVDATSLRNYINNRPLAQVIPRQ
jgi:hypothetical protein